MKIDDLSLPLKGKCHCGSVRFEVSTNIKNLRRCNCSICSRKGFVMGTALIDELTITEGKDFLKSYKWNTKVAEHYFCKICGINTHHKRRSDPNQYGYNIGCIEGFEMSWIDNAPFVDNRGMSLINSKNNKTK